MKLTLDVSGEGAPLVLVGGGLTGVASWVAHAETLAPRRRVALAQPLGVQLGIEQAPLPAGYSIELESHALAESLADLAWTQPLDLVGWSLGGAIALDFALDQPARIRSLVLVEPDTPWALTDQARAHPEVRKAEQNANRWVAGVSEDDLAAFMGEMLGPGSSPRDHPRWPVWNAHRGALRALFALHAHRDDVSRVRAFNRPVLLVKGEGTEVYNLLMIDALERLLPERRTLELPGGHLAPVVAKDQFLDRMEAFQRDLR